MQNKSALRELEAHAEAVTLRQCLGLVVEHCMLDDHMEHCTTIASAHKAIWTQA